jgi:glyoxylase-like metal-dependent hydrolase (beta-lactamase superfamily II)
MNHRSLLALLCVSLLAVAAYVAGRASGERPAAPAWSEVAPGVLRSPGLPAGYALLAGDRALLIDAPCGPEGLQAHGVKAVEAVLLTHHHRDSCAGAGRYLADKVPVRAPRDSADLLSPEGVRKYWQESLPLRNSRTNYLVLPEGLSGIDCTLQGGQTIDWHGWSVEVVAAPGHSRDHVAYAVRRGKKDDLLLFCGDALASPGKLWSPYTTDWDHWTDQGLKPSHESLRKLASLKPALLLPAHGDVIRRRGTALPSRPDGSGEPSYRDPAAALEQAARAVEEMAFLKSFERFTKERLKDAPQYRFLAKEQATTNGSKPWSRISEHLFLTGNTYVLVSRDNAFLVVDPWDPHSAKQIPKLKADQKLGPLEVVLCSHAHFDHYDGIYTILERDKPQFWTLDRVATPLADPYLLRAPFLDPRPVKIDRRFRDGETAAWREYTLRFVHLPGQTEFTMGVQTEIDGKKCFFTADNFFHQDQFTGTGGWMGLNRSWPLPYAASARKVLDAAPDWVLAEHGGAMEFSAEDFRRRVQWGQVSAQAADAICVSGSHRVDWDPHRVHVEPLVQKAKAGDTLRGTLVASNPLARGRKLTVTLQGRGLTPDQRWDLDVAAGQTTRQAILFRLGDTVGPGRHVFALRVEGPDGPDPSDAFVVADVGP